MRKVSPLRAPSVCRALAGENGWVGHTTCTQQHVGMELPAGNTCGTEVCEGIPCQNSRLFRAKPCHDCDRHARSGIGWDATSKVGDAAPVRGAWRNLMSVIVVWQTDNLPAGHRTGLYETRYLSHHKSNAVLTRRSIPKAPRRHSAQNSYSHLAPLHSSSCCCG